MDTTSQGNPGGAALGDYLRANGWSIQGWCKVKGLDRIQIQRLIKGFRGQRVSVNLAFRIQDATSGKVQARLFRTDLVEAPASVVPRRKSA